MAVEATLANTFGASYLGVCFCAILFGIATVQTYQYFSEYPEDRTRQKITVALLWILEAFHVVLTIHIGYYYAVDAFANPTLLMTVPWSAKLRVAIDVVIILSVQTLYAIRLRKLGSYYHKYVPWIIISTMPAGYALGILMVVKTYQYSGSTSYMHTTGYIIASFAWITFTDILIAVSMCYYLGKNRHMLDNRGTRSMIRRIMMYTMASGALTSACSIVVLITLATMNNNFIWLLFEFVITELYFNSFLTMLNSRTALREKSQHINDQDTHLSRMFKASPSSTQPNDPSPVDSSRSTTTHTHSLSLVSHDSQAKALNASALPYPGADGNHWQPESEVPSVASSEMTPTEVVVPELLQNSERQGKADQWTSGSMV